MEILTLDTKSEADFFLEVCEKNSALFDEFTHVGAMSMVGKTDWHWVSNGKRIDYQLKWLAGQPDNYYASEFCLGIIKRGSFSFCDLYCYGGYETKFVCQRNEI